MPTYERKAFVSVTADTVEDAEELFAAADGLTFGISGAQGEFYLSLDDGPAEDISEEDFVSTQEQ